MNKLSRPTLDALAPLRIVELQPAKHIQQEFQTLTDLFEACDGALLGKIVQNRIFRIERKGADEAYFTTIRVEGKRFGSATGRCPVCLDITFRGGSIHSDRGVFAANTPASSEVREGVRALFFHRWTADLGAGIKGVELLGRRAGLFLIRGSQHRAWVRGRGAGFAVPRDLPLAELKSRWNCLGAAAQGADQTFPRSKPSPTP